MGTYKQRLRSIRGMLDYLYGDMDSSMSEVAGSWTTKMAVSDAIDALDKGIAACPDEKPADV